MDKQTKKLSTFVDKQTKKSLTYVDKQTQKSLTNVDKQTQKLMTHVVKQKTIVIFYTEILTGKVVLWCFFSSEKSPIQLFKSKYQFRT